MYALDQGKEKRYAIYTKLRIVNFSKVSQEVKIAYSYKHIGGSYGYPNSRLAVPTSIAALRNPYSDNNSLVSESAHTSHISRVPVKVA